MIILLLILLLLLLLLLGTYYAFVRSIHNFETLFREPDSRNAQTLIFPWCRSLDRIASWHETILFARDLFLTLAAFLCINRYGKSKRSSSTWDRRHLVGKRQWICSCVVSFRCIPGNTCTIAVRSETSSWRSIRELLCGGLGMESQHEASGDMVRTWDRMGAKSELG